MEFAILYWYMSGGNQPEHGGLSNFTTDQPIREFTGGLFNALAELSGEDWHIVHVEPLINSHPPQRKIWLQRPKRRGGEKQA